MTVDQKVLGQVDLAAITEATVYTVPASTSAVISTIVVCNRGADTTFRLSVAVGGGATADKDYLCYNVPLSAGDSYACTWGITLGAGDKLKAYAGTTDVSVSAFGVEKS